MVEKWCTIQKQAIARFESIHLLLHRASASVFVSVAIILVSDQYLMSSVALFTTRSGAQALKLAHSPPPIHI